MMITTMNYMVIGLVDPLLMGLHEQVNAQLPKGMQLAHDGLVIEVKNTAVA